MTGVTCRCWLLGVQSASWLHYSDTLSKHRCPHRTHCRSIHWAPGVQKLVSAKNFQATVHVDGQVAEGEVAAITIANAAPPFSVLAHGHTGECIYDGGSGLCHSGTGK
jgi:hypothetical protein